jgi:hypothetical protein
MRVESVIQINAPQEVVWAVTVDFACWPEWTPTMESVKRLDAGPLCVGSVARIKQPRLPEAEWRVTALTLGKRFTWETRVRGIHMVASHELSATDGGTRNLLRLERSIFSRSSTSPAVATGVASIALPRENFVGRPSRNSTRRPRARWYRCWRATMRGIEGRLSACLSIVQIAQ